MERRVDESWRQGREHGEAPAPTRKTGGNFDDYVSTSSRRCQSQRGRKGGGAGEIRVPLSSDVTADQKFLARQVAEQGNF